MSDSARTDFSILMDRVKCRSEGATRALVEEYGDLILRAVRRRLHRDLRPKFDSTDFVQAVWASFFAIDPDRVTFKQPAQLAVFLTRLAQHKVVECVRQRLMSQKYNVNREQPLESRVTGAPLPLTARGHSPEEIAIAREEVQRLLDSYGPRDREIFLSLGAGFKAEEIAQHLGVSTKTVHRVTQRLKSRKSHES